MGSERRASRKVLTEEEKRNMKNKLFSFVVIAHSLPVFTSDLFFCVRSRLSYGDSLYEYSYGLLNNPIIIWLRLEALRKDRQNTFILSNAIQSF